MGAVEPVEVTDLVASMQVLAARFDPDAVADGDVDGVMTDLGQVLRLVQGMATLMARRVAEARTGQASGPAAAVAVIAGAVGVSAAEARRRLATSARLADQHDIAVAVRDGRLSDAQVDAVTDAVAADPAAAARLLTAAADQTVTDLRRTCRDTKIAGDPDPAATRRRHLRHRTCRSWNESDGEWKAMLSGPADYGARFDAAIRATHDRIFRDAYAAGEREPATAYRIDAVLAVLEHGADADDHVADALSGGGDTGGRTGPGDPGDRATGSDTGGRSGTGIAGPGDSGDRTGSTDARPADAVGTDDTSDAGTCRADASGSETAGGAATATVGRGRGRRRSGRETKVIITVDAAALARGTVQGEETCDIAGIGRVSLPAVQALIPDAHIAYVITNARDVSVAHLGRQVTAHQRTALEARGYECEVPGCCTAHLLEIDHVRDWAISRKTVLADLAWLCMVHHDHKTTRGYQLSGPPGHRTWHDPNGRVIAHDLDPPTESAA
ncbi:hypothetical protein BH23ACT9_BH23ACT9_19340 [soil metagenome]